MEITVKGLKHPHRYVLDAAQTHIYMLMKKVRKHTLHHHGFWSQAGGCPCPVHAYTVAPLICSEWENHLKMSILLHQICTWGHKLTGGVFTGVINQLSSRAVFSVTSLQSELCNQRRHHLLATGTNALASLFRHGCCLCKSTHLTKHHPLIPDELVYILQDSYGRYLKSPVFKETMKKAICPEEHKFR